MDTQKTVFDEKSLLREIQKEMKQICKPMFSIAELKPGEGDTLSHLLKQLKALPEEGMFSHLKTKYLPILQQLVEEMIKNFKKTEAAYLRAVKERGVIFREVNQGWRVGPLFLETKSAQGKARFCYNREPLTSFFQVDSVSALEEGEKLALQWLDVASIEQEKLIHWMWVAYKKAIVTKYNQLEGQAVPIQEMAGEFLQLVAQDHELSKTLGSVMKHDRPLWIFLYNLDRYRLIGGQVPAHQRIMLQTGSQQEASKGLGVTVNGLFPEEDYKTMCYVIQGT